MTAPVFVYRLAVSWDEIHRAARFLASRLVDRRFDRLVAVTRGGLVPSAILARELDIRTVDTVCVTSYNHQTQSETRILKGIEGDGDGWLMVDDLVDTGRTAKVVRDMLPKALFVTLYAKPAGRPFVDLFVAEVNQDTWIDFPWDVDTSIAYAEPFVSRFRSGPR